MFRRHPLIWRTALFVLLPALAVAAYMGWWLQRTLPIVDGGQRVPGIEAPITIERDDLGVPRITAANERDAWFAVGYVHAQDRMWQLELQRRIASGRLSEVFGKATVQQDIWFRTLGLVESARQAWLALSPEAQASLQAYSEGINHWLASDAVLAVEFTLLDVEPAPWTVYDSLAVVKMLALNLGGNHRREIERMLLARVLDSSQLNALYPGFSASVGAPLAMSEHDLGQFASLTDMLDSIETQLGMGARGAGSNAWAVAGGLTGDGGTLLASDPHLSLQIPSFWYMAAIRGGDLDVAGATMVGLPIVLFGRNESIAWAGTNLMADVQDIFLEQVDPRDPGRYRRGNDWLRFNVRTEQIKVKQGFPSALRSPLQPLQVRVRSSEHGPVVSDVVGVFDQPAVLRWTALDVDDTSYEAFYRLNHAADWPAFEQALDALVAPAMNVLYTDRLGNIGHVVAGRVPQRAAGNGMLPVPAWSGEFDWSGVVPSRELPRRYNPSSGVLVSANEDAFAGEYAYLIGTDWAPPTRAERIAELLARGISSAQPLDADVMQQIQADTRNRSALNLRDRLIEIEPTGPQRRRALELLAGWDGDMSRDSEGATLFNAWAMQLRGQIISRQLGTWWNLGRERRYLAGLAESIDLDSAGRLLDGTDPRWCGEQRNDEIGPCDAIITSALDAALADIEKRSGSDDPDDWAWGELHHTLYRHMPFSQANVLRSLFERKIASGGSSDSINVSSYTPVESGYAQDFGAGVRQIVALSKQSTEHRFMNSTGQSGNVVSRHYDDMIEPFRNVETTQFDQPTVFRLTLIPADGEKP